MVMHLPCRCAIEFFGETSRIAIETEPEPTLEQTLAGFDPQAHGGEAMDGGADGVEAFAQGGS